MINIPNYSLFSKIYESANSLVYRAIRSSDKQPFILKVLKEYYPTPSELTRYKQEYQITRNLNVEGVIKAYSLEPYQRTLIIILEDFGASSLKELMKGDRIVFSLEQFLAIAIKTTEILGKIHACGVIHKDINPSNIVFNPNTKELKIIDFGIATTFSRENHSLKNPNRLEGTLAYISPEQTGRMNRSLDYRTDFYSLGITFYELLTGQLPFQSNDALELVHCHIAKQPVSPHQIKPEIPEVVSHIVMKLMAKTAEERYQTAWGIKSDLEDCLAQLQTQGFIDSFPLASQDISARLQISQKLYGRETEVKTLLTAFEKVASGVGSGLAKNLKKKRRISQKNRPSDNYQSKIQNPKSKIQMMLVAGYSGVGKSVLVQELYKPITEKRGYFISGKFDQLQRNIPYSAVVNAFKELMGQLLTESEEKLNQWREKLLTALGVNAQIIIDVIPEVELIVGKQPAVPSLGPTESQNRFNFVFQNFIRSFCTKEHPLVIFLDDLHWADSASLKLIELMMTDTNTQYLFLIGAYRDNEVNSTHPLMIILDRLLKVGTTIDSIVLAPLTVEAIAHLIADTLHSDIVTVKPLAELLVRKTEGNPFFVNEFLKTLHAENLLTLNPPHSLRTSGEIQGGFWDWDISQIEAKSISDNVVDLMIAKVKKLPESTQQVLRLAACMGASFSLNTLSIVCEKLPVEVYQHLTAALQSGLILPTSELDDRLLIQNYKFLHDRVQQAASALISDEAHKQAVHLQIGRLLLQNTPPEERSEYIFEIIDRLNLGVQLVSDREEREEIAKLNLMAGQKAKASIAYGVAIVYFNAGLKLLLADSWHSSYHLTLALYEEAAEVAYLNGDFEQMERLVEVVLNHAKTVLDKVKVYKVKIQASVSQSNLLEALKIALVPLNLLGLILPENPSQLDIQKGMEETALLLEGHEIEDLIDLPEMKDPEKLATMLFLSSITAAAYRANPELLLLIELSKINLSIKYGNAALSAFGYVGYAVVLGEILQDIESAYKFGKLSLTLAERLNCQAAKAKVCIGVGAHITHWKEHFKETISILLEGYQSGVEMGDFEYAGYCACYVCQHLYFMGHELTELEQQIETYSKVKYQIMPERSFNWMTIFQQAVFNLLGKSENPIRLFGDAYNESESLPQAIAANDRLELLYFYSNKLILCYLFGSPQQALENAAIAHQYKQGLGTIVVTGLLHLYDSLAHLSAFVNASNTEKEAWLERVNANQEKIQKWAEYAPMNYLHKFYLVEAEKARVLGQFFEAEELYEQAIQGAANNGFIQEEALAYELAAKFYLDRGRWKFAQTYMKEAHYAYRRWGALAKVKDLEQRYSQLLQYSTDTLIASGRTKTTTTSTNSQSGEALDLATVIKASQAISGEIVLDKLLASLMKITLENAGAQIGHLILKTKGQLLIEASGAVDSDNITVLQSMSIDNVLSTAIVNYVARTSKSVVLSNATVEGNFTQDSYIQQHQPKSILCFPLSDRGQLISIIYLENNLTTGAFTSERLEVLKILSTQAAISIENARLYQTLDDKVKERTTQLAEANQEISALNHLLKAENLRMKAELDVTKQLQQMILPKPDELSLIEALEITGFMEPADEVGGDYYDVLQQDGKVTIGIGDVTGHGLESGVLMLMTQTAVRTLQESNQTDPVQFLEILNRTLYRNAQRINPYKNLTLTLLDYANGTLNISGQHEEIIIVRAGGELERIDTRYLGFPIAIEEEIADFISSEQVQLNSGDVVVLYTDGVTEAFNCDRQQYGLERLCEVVRLNCSLSVEEIKEAIIEDLWRHIGKEKVFDDITLVVLKQK